MSIWKFLYIEPDTKKSSLSRLMTIISFIGVLVASALDMAGKVKGTSVILEVYASTMGLYFGRRLNFGKDKSVEAAEKEDA